MKRIKTTRRFEKDYALAARRGKSPEKLKDIMAKLAMNETLAPRHRDHPLIGDWTGHRECHIEPDWLLIYRTTEEEITFERMGSHADLFR